MLAERSKCDYIFGPFKQHKLIIYMIPEEKKSAVANALNVAFGTSEIEDIRQLTAGLSTALIFRIVVKGKAYLLRVITRTDAMADPTHYYSCMEPAAEAGLAPKVWYAGIEDRISITDFIEPNPFPIELARIKMPSLLKDLHALPPFPHTVKYIDFVDGIVQKFRESKILPERMTEDLFDQYARISKIYPRTGPDMVACHNDLKPENIIYDGERPWLVDWEAAFLNDRYSDLSIVKNFVVKNDDEEKEFLRNYFGTEPTDYQLARLFLMQQVVNMAYFVFFLNITAKTPVDLDFNRWDFRGFHDGIWSGKITLETDEIRQQYGLIHMEQLRHNFQLKRFEESLKIVTDHK